MPAGWVGGDGGCAPIAAVLSPPAANSVRKSSTFSRNVAFCSPHVFALQQAPPPMNSRITRSERPGRTKKAYGDPREQRVSPAGRISSHTPCGSVDRSGMWYSARAAPSSADAPEPGTNSRALTLPSNAAMRSRNAATQRQSPHVRRWWCSAVGSVGKAEDDEMGRISLFPSGTATPQLGAPPSPSLVVLLCSSRASDGDSDDAADTETTAGSSSSAAAPRFASSELAAACFDFGSRTGFTAKHGNDGCSPTGPMGPNVARSAEKPQRAYTNATATAVNMKAPNLGRKRIVAGKRKMHAPAVDAAPAVTETPSVEMARNVRAARSVA